MAARYHRVRRRLDTCTDAELRALLARVQALPLDRPRGSGDLMVDLVSNDEARLLALYRVLPPVQRHDVLALAEQAHATRPCAAPRPGGTKGGGINGISEQL